MRYTLVLNANANTASPGVKRVTVFYDYYFCSYAQIVGTTIVNTTTTTTTVVFTLTDKHALARKRRGHPQRFQHYFHVKTHQRIRRVFTASRT